MSIRISTNTWFDSGAGRLNDLQSRLNKLQEQVSLGKRIMVPSDDPVGAAQVLELTQGQSINKQFTVNRQNARNALELEEHVLQGVTTAIQNAHTLVVEAGNGGFKDDERRYLATELSGYLEDLFGQANSRDAEGNFIFGGYRVSETPYVKVPGGARFDGDQGQNQLQVGPLRMLATSDAGSAIFDDIKTGTGLVTTAATAANAGTGVVSNASITGAVTGDPYQIVFTSATEFTIQQGSNPPTGPHAFVSGESITVGGYQLEISGAPAIGDSFSVEPSEKQSVFATLTDLVDLLNTPVTDDAGKTRLANGLNTAMNNLANALDTTLKVRADVGSRLRELDSLDTQGDERDTLYATSLQNLQDLDYTKAISDLTKQQIMLQAAQQSFVKTSGLSLFNYIS